MSVAAVLVDECLDLEKFRIETLLKCSALNQIQFGEYFVKPIAMDPSSI